MNKLFVGGLLTSIASLILLRIYPTAEYGVIALLACFAIFIFLKAPQLFFPQNSAFSFLSAFGIAVAFLTAFLGVKDIETKWILVVHILIGLSWGILFWKYVRPKDLPSAYGLTLTAYLIWSIPVLF